MSEFSEQVSKFKAEKELADQKFLEFKTKQQNVKQAEVDKLSSLLEISKKIVPLLIQSDISRTTFIRKRLIPEERSLVTIAIDKWRGYKVNKHPHFSISEYYGWILYSQHDPTPWYPDYSSLPPETSSGNLISIEGNLGDFVSFGKIANGNPPLTLTNDIKWYGTDSVRGRNCNVNELEKRLALFVINHSLDIGNL